MRSYCTPGPLRTLRSTRIETVAVDADDRAGKVTVATISAVAAAGAPPIAVGAGAREGSMLPAKALQASDMIISVAIVNQSALG